ncbi:MAG: hypothetical protein ABJB66_10620 [Gemmatimonadaceae bacterium]
MTKTLREQKLKSLHGVVRTCGLFCARITVMFMAWIALAAHVGTEQVVLEGMAGGYPVRVVIRPPGIVPAQVPIIVRVLHGSPTRVTVRATQFSVGLKGAPPAEAASVVPGEIGTYAHDLWIMTSGSYAIYVGVEGAAGNGTLLVPMVSAATHTLGMPKAIGGVLIVLGSLLAIGVFTLVGAATREATLPIGYTPDGARRKSARVAVGVSTAVVALMLLGGAKWWQSAESDYRRGLYKPLEVTTSVRMQDSDRLLKLVVTDPQWQRGRTTPITPDHGKLMHLFLIRANDAGVIAHLHPLRSELTTFETLLPAIPAGKYFLFADVLHESGFQRTLVDTVDVPVAPAIVENDNGSAASAKGMAQPKTFSAFADSDDAWRVVAPVAVGTASSFDGGSLTLSVDGQISVDRDVTLQVAVRNSDGIAAPLEPYMGMGGHMMVMREDGGVFVHLHPGGTASMTAQDVLARRERGDTGTSFSDAIKNEASMRMLATSGELAQTKSGTLTFPFAFPTKGKYRVFVQVKKNGVVQTASFALTVPK